MSLRTITATRYITPLREGGSLPAIVEADDEGMYVLKFRGAGQGPKVLIAELIAGELGRAVGLPVPELVLMQLTADLALTEPDAEIQDLIKASAGLNIAIDYLPGSVMFDPVADSVNAMLASQIVWFDAYVTNVDRTVRNTNMLMWHHRLQLIDHGASLYFHHSWTQYLERSRDIFPHIKDQVLLQFATTLREADEILAPKLSSALIEAVVNKVPETWLMGDGVFSAAADYRRAYIEYLVSRLQSPRLFVEEALRARSLLV